MSRTPIKTATGLAVAVAVAQDGVFDSQMRDQTLLEQAPGPVSSPSPAPR